MKIKEYLKDLKEKWDKYDELDGMTAISFRNDLELLLEFWDERIEKEEIHIELTAQELEELQEGKSFNWYFNGVLTHIYPEKDLPF